jgi:hypothetical protein
MMFNCLALMASLHGGIRLKMTSCVAITRAHLMIEVIRQSVAPGLAERNKAVAEGYIASLLDCGLIDRDQYEDLTVAAELALTHWAIKPGLGSHL